MQVGLGSIQRLKASLIVIDLMLKSTYTLTKVLID